MAFFQKLIPVPALALLEKVLDRSPSALTDQVRGAVNSVVRELAKKRGIVKKAQGFSFNVIKVLVDKEITPFVAELSKNYPSHSNITFVTNPFTVSNSLLCMFYFIIAKMIIHVVLFPFL